MCHGVSEMEQVEKMLASGGMAAALATRIEPPASATPAAACRRKSRRPTSLGFPSDMAQFPFRMAPAHSSDARPPSHCK